MDAVQEQQTARQPTYYVPRVMRLNSVCHSDFPSRSSILLTLWDLISSVLAWTAVPFSLMKTRPMLDRAGSRNVGAKHGALLRSTASVAPDSASRK
jgi:hypothetical protein